MPIACYRLFAAAWILLAVLGGPLALAQEDRLPNEITSAQSLNTAQQERIDRFVQRWSDVLLEGSDREVGDARAALVQPVRSAISDVFLDRYAIAIRNELSAALDARRMITRLNAMIVASTLGGRGVDSIIVNGLDDPAASVRYWAAQAVVEVAEARAQGREVSPNVIRDVLEGLEQLVTNEDSAYVLEPALRAAVRINDPAGDALFLDKLADRLSAHAAEPMLEYDAIRSAWPQLLQRAFSNNNTQLVRRSAQLAAQYFTLITGQLTGGALGAEPPQSHLDMLDFAQQTLTNAYKSLGAEGAVPNSNEVQRAISNGNWDELAVAADRWVAALKRSPFNFSDADLAVPGG